MAASYVAAGCLTLQNPLGRTGPSGLPYDPDPDDGYPPRTEEMPGERDIDPSTFPTVQEGGYEIRLVPVDVAHYWYLRREARFIDTRSTRSFEESHIHGAVHSPTNDPLDEENDPVYTWPRDDRIICYCSCPYHLATMKAADLLDRGYTEVYAIREGFYGWMDQDYPVARTED